MSNQKPKPPRENDEFFAARYMREFQCTGGACEDSCCGGWRIHVDEKHYRKLKVLMEATAPGRERFQGAFERNRSPDRTRFTYARLKLLDDGRCPMLAGDGWCDLHRNHGEAMLPDTCSAYPRSIGRLGRRRELFGSLSCPEVARRALFDEEALDLVPVDEALLARGVVKQSLLGVPVDAYVRHFDEVRHAMAELMRRDQYPMTARLFIAAHFAARTAGFYHQRTEVLDEARLRREIASLADDEALGHLARQFELAPSPMGIGIEVVVGLLAARVAGTRTDRSQATFNRLVERTMTSYAVGPDGVAHAVVGPGNLPTPEFVAAWEERKRAAPAAFTKRMERYFENYCRHVWLDEWFFDSPDLFVFTQTLLVRIALLRFLLVSHPAVAAAPTLSDDEAQALFDRAAVEVFYLVSREIEHSQMFLGAIARALGALSLFNLPAAVAFIKC